MSFDSDEKSVATNRPAELYEFAAPTKTYRYTSASDTIVYAGNTYTPAAIKRSTIVQTGSQDPTQFTVEAPVDLAFVADQRGVIPSQGITFTLRRLQRVSGIATVRKMGKVSSIVRKRSGNTQVAIIAIPSLLDIALATMVPGLVFQSNCNNHLYDAVCTVDRNLYKVTTTVSSIADSLNLTVGSDGGHPGDWFDGGEMIHVASGERRTILFRTGGTSFRIKDPFPALANGDSLQLFAGCKKRLDSDCLNKFNNVVNFTGFPFIPEINPFKDGFR
jgi:hypothetical protein